MLIDFTHFDDNPYDNVHNFSEFLPQFSSRQKWGVYGIKPVSQVHFEEGVAAAAAGAGFFLAAFFSAI